MQRNLNLHGETADFEGSSLLNHLRLIPEFGTRFNIRQLAGMRLIAALTAGVFFCLPGDYARATERRNHGNDLRIVVLKTKQLLELHHNGTRLKTYRVCLGINPYGPKIKTGDRRTPEGEYFICMKNRASRFHLFMGISYPGEHDAQAAFEKGRISLNTRNSIIEKIRRGEAPPWNTKLGGWVGIHGYPTKENDRRWISLLYPKPHNWTDGCIALWNFEIEELFAEVPLGTPVTILP